jgi:hypothetical protein
MYREMEIGEWLLVVAEPYNIKRSLHQLELLSVEMT